MNKLNRYKFSLQLFELLKSILTVKSEISALRIERLFLKFGGAREDRTPDLLRARQALSQLSYGPLLGLIFFPIAALLLVLRRVTY